MSRPFWLQNSGILWEVQTTIENLPLEGSELLNSRMDEILETQEQLYVLGTGTQWPKERSKHVNNLPSSSASLPSTIISPSGP